MLPMGGHKFAPNPWFVDNRPEIYIGMGLTAERLQKKYGISREEQDQFALRSHTNALRAQTPEAISTTKRARQRTALPRTKVRAPIRQWKLSRN